MKLHEVVTRTSDRAAEREKHEKKEAAMRDKAVKAYVRGLTAPQYHPHYNDISNWLFGKGDSDDEAVQELKAWVTAIGRMADVDPFEEDPFDDDFKAFSHHIDIPADIVEFVIDGGKLPEEKKK